MPPGPSKERSEWRCGPALVHRQSCAKESGRTRTRASPGDPAGWLGPARPGLSEPRRAQAFHVHLSRDQLSGPFHVHLSRDQLSGSFHVQLSRDSDQLSGPFHVPLSRDQLSGLVMGSTPK